MDWLMDEIQINQLKVSCVIGVHAFERSSRQQLLISVILGSKGGVARAAATDSLADTVDYVTACNLINGIAVEGKFQLVETLAEAIAVALLTLPGVNRVELQIQKPAAVLAAESVGVKIVRMAG